MVYWIPLRQGLEDKMNDYKTYIFDLDDTLVKCGIYYTEAKWEFVDIKSMSTGFDREFCFNMVGQVDVLSTQLPNAFGLHRFPRSLYSTSVLLDSMASPSEINYEEADRCMEIGYNVYEQPYPLIENVIETLSELKSRGKNLLLFTKGDETLQRTKISRNGLDIFFDENNSKILSGKGISVMEELMYQFNIDPENSIAIGDSIKDDVVPAHANNIDSALVSKEVDPAWIYYDNSYPNIDPTYKLESLRDIIPRV